MLRFIDGENTSRYSTGSPGRENAPAVAEPPTKPIRPGRAAVATALTASRFNHRAPVPRYFSMKFITATNPPFIASHKAIAVASCAMKHAGTTRSTPRHPVAISRLANDSDSARTQEPRIYPVTSGNNETSEELRGYAESG